MSEGKNGGKPESRPVRKASRSRKAARAENAFFETRSLDAEIFPEFSTTDDWYENASLVCAPGAQGGQGYTQKEVAELLEVARLSRSCAAMLDSPELKDLSIVFDRQTQSSALRVSASEDLSILLNPGRTASEIILMFFRELRRAWQHRKGLLENPLVYDSEDAILLNRVQQADLLSLSARMAWELNLAGCTNAWDWLSGSHHFGLARAFVHRAREDFRSLNSGAACRAAYDAWFESEMPKIHDRRIIHEMLLDENGYVFGEARQSKLLTPEFMARFGEMPLGGNYFRINGARRPDDPDYAIVEDRSNANFLWFVKFERSFLDKERELAENAADILPFSPSREKAVEEHASASAEAGESGKVYWLVPRAIEAPRS